MPTHTFRLNGSTVVVDVESDVRLLWVLRDILGVTGPKYGCGLSICQACTSHINGKAFNPCAVPVGDLRPSDEITTIEGLADTVESELHPVQEVWLDEDVAQCGFCQPGQIMAAVALIQEAQSAGRDITDEDLDALRNVCRCGTYPRIRTAIIAAAEVMAAAPRRGGRPDADSEEGAVVATARSRTAGDVGAARSLPETGGESLLAPATIAAGTAVAVRLASGRGSPGSVPPQADAGEAERGHPDG